VVEKNMSKDTTILYFTDSVLDPFIAEICRKKLLEVSGGRKIVSVSQKPLDFGDNICVGEIGRSGLSFDKQIYIGSENIKTKYVAIAEHDCIYPSEHFDYVPGDEINFWYNMNVWFLQYQNTKCPENNGMYSYWRGRRAHSQLICNADRYMQACKARLEITSDPNWSARYKTGRVAEPGAVNYDHTIKLAKNKDVQHMKERLAAYIFNFQGREWRTKIPTIDIRHGDNFSGPRRGKNRCFSLEPWGTIKDVLNV
jgi:hypothetical protein